MALQRIDMQINGHVVTVKLQKLPACPCTHRPKDHSDARLGTGMKAACRYHGGETLPQATGEIVVFGFDDNRHGRGEHELRGLPAEEKVDEAGEPARRINVKEDARKDTRLARKVPAHVEQYGHDEEF